MDWSKSLRETTAATPRARPLAFNRRYSQAFAEDGGQSDCSAENSTPSQQRTKTPKPVGAVDRPWRNAVSGQSELLSPPALQSRFSCPNPGCWHCLVHKRRCLAKRAPYLCAPNPAASSSRQWDKAGHATSSTDSNRLGTAWQHRRRPSGLSQRWRCV